MITRAPRDLFYSNIKAYENLKKVEAKNLRPTIIAGFGISESILLGSNRSIMSIVSRENTPIYHPDVWADEFRTLYKQFTDDWKVKNDVFNKMPMYGIKDEFNYMWVTYALRQAKKIYGTKFYDSAYSERSEVIENKVRELLQYFFLTGNQEYYSELIR